jgi:DNA polymerase-1
MLAHGTGKSGLAILGLVAGDKDSHSRKPLHRLPLVWKAIPQGQLEDVYCATLFRFLEPVVLGEVPERGAKFLSQCEARGVRVIVAIGTQALKAVSPIYGSSAKLLGATVEVPGRPYVIPVDTHYSIRALRSYAWLRAMVRFVQRGRALAAGRGHMFKFPPLVIGDTREAEQALERILDERLPVGNDVETTGKDFRSDPITAMGLANANVAVSMPWQPYHSRLYGPQRGVQSGRIIRLVKQILGHAHITKIFHNGMFDLSVLASRGVRVAGPIEDTLLAHKIVYPDLFHNLQFCMSYEFAVHPWKTVFDLERKRRHEGDDWADTDPIPLMKYNAQDAAAECPLWERLAEMLGRTHRGWENYAKLKELASPAADMQYKGVAIDLGARNQVAAGAEQRIAEIEQRWAAEVADVPLSGPGSAKGIARLFFHKYKAPVLARSRISKRPQLSSAVLLEYAGSKDNPPLAQAAWTLFEFRKIKKTYDAFLAPLTTDRVYAKPNPSGTRGSRFSYSEPNLQQWSKEKTILSPLTGETVALAPNLRHLILPDAGMVLGEHDYNALEVRIMACAANISMWSQWLRDGVDMHSEHARLMFGRIVKKSDPLRQITKVLTFARFYNRRKSVGAVLRALKPSMPSLTEAFLLDVFERFDKAVPAVVSWQDKVEATVRARGYVELPISGARQYHDRRHPDVNAAPSFGIQSTGGDIINAAALRIRPRLAASRGERILLNVHDALLWQAPPERVHAVAAIVREEMERAVDIWEHVAVVFPTECKVGNNWRDLKDLSKWAE